MHDKLHNEGMFGALCDGWVFRKNPIIIWMWIDPTRLAIVKVEGVADAEVNARLSWPPMVWFWVSAWGNKEKRAPSRR